MRKKLLSLLLLGSICLCGCGDYDEISKLEELQALNSESSVNSKDYSLSYTDEQEMIYAQVSDRTLLDLSTLDACGESELQQVLSYMDVVDEQLCGKVASKDGMIDEKFISYLLTEFEKTPYHWQRTKTTVRGIDAKSRSIVVDVDYSTINFEKDVIPASKIVKGEPNYDTLMTTRLNHYTNLLSAKYSMSTNTSSNYNKQLEEFTNAYGKPEEIYESQRNVTLSEGIYETGIQKTYSGCIDTDLEKSGAKMTVRYILVPNYKLGINLGLNCEHMYLINYKLDTDPTEGRSIFSDEGYATVTNSIYKLIYSYFTCIDESDFSGLYKLTSNFKDLDKYYSDMFENVYRKHDNFSISLFNIQGTHIECGVSIASKIRCKGSNMTFPNYTDRYYFEIEFIDEDLRVTNMTLLSRVIEGEPAIASNTADVSGFTAEINLNNDDKVAIENLICNFSAVQLLGDTSSDDFGNLVDLSMTTSELSELQSSMTSMSGSKKVVWLQNYQQGTTNYASVRCRELFQDDSNTIVEADSTYDFISKGGRWYVYKYLVNSTVKLDTTNLVTTGSLCLCSPGKVDSYASQIKSTTSTDLDNVSDTSVVVEHQAYTPTRKTGTAEQGKVKIKADNFTEDVFNKLVVASNANNWDMEYLNSWKNFKDFILDAETWDKTSDFAGLGLDKSIFNDIQNLRRSVYIYRTNIALDNYTPKEENTELLGLRDSCSKLLSDISNYKNEVTDATVKDKLEELNEVVKGIYQKSGGNL